MSLKKMLSGLNQISALALIVWVCLPWVAQNMGLVAGFLLAALWSVTAILLHPPKKIGWDEGFMVLFLLCVISSFFLYGRIYEELAFYYAVSMIALFFLPYYMMKFYIAQEKTKFLGSLAVCAMLCMIVGAITSSYFTALDSNIMKTISQAKDTEFVELRKAGIGSFGFVYMLVFCVIALVGFYKNKIKMNAFLKIVSVIFLIAAIKCIIDSTFTTALLLTVLGVLLVLVTSKKNPQLNPLIYVFVAVGFLLMSRLLGQLLANITVASEDVTIRLNEIGQLLLGEEVGTNVGGRWEYMKKSFDCFLEYPLFGYNMQENPTVSFGGHSEWFDLLAVYGLCGGIPLLATVIYKLRQTKQTMKNTLGYPFYGAVLLIFCIFGFLDPFLRLYHIGFALFLIIPSFACLSRASDKKGEKHENC